MRWTKLCILACVSLTACTVGVVKKESFMPTTTSVLPPSELPPYSTPTTLALAPVVLTPTPLAQPNPIITSPLPSPTPWPIVTLPSFVTVSAPEVMEECAALFERRALNEPYPYQLGHPRYTLSVEELNSYLALMGIESLCIPLQLGAPFIGADWDSRQIPAFTGRRVRINFEGDLDRAGWINGFIVYSTYDFVGGSEYVIFATQEDREAVVHGAMPDMIEVDGIKGFIRFKPGLSYGTQSVYKTHVFPFETYYIAVVFDIGAYDPSDVEAVLQKLRAGEYPADDLYRLRNMQAMDFLALSIQFR